MINRSEQSKRDEINSMKSSEWSTRQWVQGFIDHLRDEFKNKDVGLMLKWSMGFKGFKNHIRNENNIIEIF